MFSKIDIINSSRNSSSRCSVKLAAKLLVLATELQQQLNFNEIDSIICSSSTCITAAVGVQ